MSEVALSALLASSLGIVAEADGMIIGRPASRPLLAALAVPQRSAFRRGIVER